MSARRYKDLTWICPNCREYYYGWSKLKKCDVCGYEEKELFPALGYLKRKIKLFLKNKSGITLLELMVGIAIIGILIGIAVPSFSGWLSHFKLRSASMELLSDFRLARSLSARNNTPYMISFTSPISESSYSLRSYDPSSGEWLSDIFVKNLKDESNGIIEIISINDSNGADISDFTFSTNGAITGTIADQTIPTLLPLPPIIPAPVIPVPPYTITLERIDNYSEELTIEISMAGNITIQ